jgi:hypothetical protein
MKRARPERRKTTGVSNETSQLFSGFYKQILQTLTVEDYWIFLVPGDVGKTNHQ